jgi:uncharacterized membrane protein YeiH
MFDVIGTIAFALSGYLASTKRKLDILGIFLISFSTALGGGILRDISVNKIPFSFTAINPFLLVVGTIFLSYILKLQKYNLESIKTFIYADTIGLLSFSVTGSIIAVEQKLSIVGVMFLSLLTATGGGVIRDLLLQKKPSILYEDIYGTFSLIIGMYIYYLGVGFHLYIFLISLFFVRIYIKMKGFNLPKID